MNWLKQQAANIAGTTEPVYGPSAIQPVGKRGEASSYTELKRENLKWATPKHTCVETQTFYLFAKTGHIAMVQIIYSNVAGLRTTCQFNSKIFYPDGKENLWSSDPIHNHHVSADASTFKADGCAIQLSDDGNTYSITSNTNKNAVVDLKIHRKTPGFVAGTDGISNFGTDPASPWGTMRHMFWPRAQGSGDIITKEGPISFNDSQALFIHALQGMKPHHAAARWNFVDFHSPNFSAVMMEFTTPPSYGETVVNVGGVVKDGEIIYAGTTNTAKHTQIEKDSDNDWPAPTAADFKWSGKTADGKPFTAELSGSLGKRLDRVDVMAEVPGFIKSFVGAAVGTKPYIYQYSPAQRLKLKVNIDGQETEEEGMLFQESTFISSK